MTPHCMRTRERAPEIDTQRITRNVRPLPPERPTMPCPIDPQRVYRDAAERNALARARSAKAVSL